MKGRVFSKVGLVVVFAASMWQPAKPAQALVPAPPVNQNIGIFETRFDQRTEAECRGCHVNVSNNELPPDGIPVDTTYLPDRHHLLVGTLVNKYSAAPNAPRTVAPPKVNEGTRFECLTCHDMEYDALTYSWKVVLVRDCMQCHKPLPNGSDHHNWSPHHTTDLAWADLDGDGVQDTNAAGEPVTYCSACHGSLVDDMGDGHTKPTYSPSLVTPQPSRKDSNYDGIPDGWVDANGDGVVQSNEVAVVQGNCNFCHDEGTHTDGREVIYNMLSHHGAGFYAGVGECTWCHIMVEKTDPANGSTWFSPDSTDPLRIRSCENCHGISSLHNIQVDSDNPENPGIIRPGEENPYYGHIGNNADCQGCHGFQTVAAAAAPGSGALVPYIYDFDKHSVPAGQATPVTLRGAAFTNDVTGGPAAITVASELKLQAPDGTVHSLVPSSVTESNMVVTIPATLAPGNYAMQAIKGPKVSNRTVLAVLPALGIDSATGNADGSVTLTGSGFSGYVGADNSGTNLTVSTMTTNKKGKTSSETSSCEVISWADTVIKANCPISCGLFTVNNVFGQTEQFEVPCPTPDPGGKPPKGGGKGRNK